MIKSKSIKVSKTQFLRNSKTQKGGSFHRKKGAVKNKTHPTGTLRKPKVVQEGYPTRTLQRRPSSSNPKELFTLFGVSPHESDTDTSQARATRATQKAREEELTIIAGAVKAKKELEAKNPNFVVFQLEQKGRQARLKVAKNVAAAKKEKEDQQSLSYRNMMNKAILNAARFGAMSTGLSQQEEKRVQEKKAKELQKTAAKLQVLASLSVEDPKTQKTVEVRAHVGDPASPKVETPPLIEVQIRKKKSTKTSKPISLNELPLIDKTIEEIYNRLQNASINTSNNIHQHKYEQGIILEKIKPSILYMNEEYQNKKQDHKKNLEELSEKQSEMRKNSLFNEYENIVQKAAKINQKLNKEKIAIDNFIKGYENTNKELYDKLSEYTKLKLDLNSTKSKNSSSLINQQKIDALLTDIRNIKAQSFNFDIYNKDLDEIVNKQISYNEQKNNLQAIIEKIKSQNSKTDLNKFNEFLKKQNDMKQTYKTLTEYENSYAYKLYNILQKS
jgi:hypothetical protein